MASKVERPKTEKQTTMSQKKKKRRPLNNQQDGGALHGEAGRAKGFHDAKAHEQRG